jgi:sec-independent protein translocase protein TatB
VFLDLSFTKLLILAVIALVVFGPDRLPGLATQAGRMLRELRRMADGARSELQDQLGPEFSQFDLNDLNPKHFVRKHLLDDVTGDGAATGAAGNGSGNGNGNGNGLGPMAAAGTEARLRPGESPPYDAEAT